MSSASEIISNEVPWEKWNLLSAVEISVLKSLNFKLLPENKKKERVKKEPLETANAPAPHVTEVIVDCNFCHTVFSVHFNMVPVENALVSVKISEGHFADLVYNKKVRREKVLQKAITCEHCEKMLSEKSKDDLISIILMQQIKIKTGRFSK